MRHNESIGPLATPHRQEFEQLARRIKEVAGGRPVDYVANPGNWGDGLIRAGTLQFFERFEIPIRELRPNHSYTASRDMIALYGGGGGWCRFWNHGEPFVRSLAQSYRHVIVLPTTYDVPCDIPKVTFIARDRFESLTNAPRAMFCHDMAFSIGSCHASLGKGIGFFLRTDKESLRGMHVLPAKNTDMSLMGHAHAETASFLEAIAKYEVVVTDRLHVAIGGYLLGRQVRLLENGYFKNRAVYLSSMSHCPRVSFYSWSAPPPEYTDHLNVASSKADSV